MNKTKVARRRRRNSKASGGRSRHESIKAVVKKKTERSPSRKQVGSRHVVPSPRVLTNKEGKIVDAINCLYDVIDFKRPQAAAMHMAAVVQSSHDAIAAKTLKGIITTGTQAPNASLDTKQKRSSADRS